MKNYFLFLIISTAICMVTDAVAMNQEMKEELPNSQHIGPTIHLILPPEEIDNINKMNFMATKYPQIAREVPLITSLEEFEAAKEYLELIKKYNRYLFAGATCGPTANDLKDQLIENSQHVLKGMLTHIDILQGASCKAFRSPEDEKTFSDSVYEVHYNIAHNHLMLLTATILSPKLKNNSSAINAHVKEIKKIKEILSGNSQYRKQLQQLLQETQEYIPMLVPYFNPQAQVQSPRSFNQRGGRIEKQRTVNYYQKFSDRIPEKLIQEVGSFDSYFNVKSKGILKDYLALTVKKIPHEDYVQQVQNLTEEYKVFEKRGTAFKAYLPGETSLSQSEILTSGDLTVLYRFFSQRYTLKNQDPLQLLHTSIFMFIQANKVEEALTRTEALKALLLEKGPLTESFVSFQASVRALNGDCEEWRNILAEKRNKIQGEKATAHQKQVDQIKDQQEKRKNEQEKQKELKKASQALVNNREVSKLSKTVEPELDPIYDAPISFETKYEPPIPREKTKTRKPAQEPIDKEISLDCNKSPSCGTSEVPQPLKDYTVSGNAFKTYQKIRRENWKFSRKNLYNLFSNLKCTVDMSQGKGCHGKISQPLNMIIRNHEGLVGVIPEFVHSELPFPLTVPDWDEKWSGIVPPYMRKSILSALDYLGATDETVHK